MEKDINPSQAFSKKYQNDPEFRREVELKLIRSTAKHMGAKIQYRDDLNHEILSIKPPSAKFGITPEMVKEVLTNAREYIHQISGVNPTKKWLSDPEWDRWLGSKTAGAVLKAKNRVLRGKNPPEQIKSKKPSSVSRATATPLNINIANALQDPTIMSDPEVQRRVNAAAEADPKVAKILYGRRTYQQLPASAPEGGESEYTPSPRIKTKKVPIAPMEGVMTFRQFVQMKDKLLYTSKDKND